MRRNKDREREKVEVESEFMCTSTGTRVIRIMLYPRYQQAQARPRSPGRAIPFG
jgi:hypothetical protein